MAESKGVLICGEVVEGRVAAITLELLGIGRKLANDLGQELSAIVLGSGLGNIGPELITHGADKVYLVDDPLLKDYQTDSYAAVMERACRQLNPDILLLGQTSQGRDLAPHLAFRLETGLAMDCIELALDSQSRRLLMTRPVYGGNANAIFACDTKPQMATVRAKALSALEPDAGRHGEVVAMEAGLDPAAIRTKVLHRVREEAAGVRLEDAEVVVTGGRGVGGPEGFATLEELAKLLGGAIGATRAACDSGWVPSTIQIGLTGKVVSPTLYIAIALSGSSQHMAGCSGSKNIVAVNRDPEANIFKQAHFGVVGDYRQVLPALAEKCRELLAG